MKIRFLSLLCLGAVATLVCESTFARAQTQVTPEKVDLQLRLQKGQTIDQTIVVSDKTSEIVGSAANSGGDRLDNYLRLRIQMRLEVVEVAENGESTLRLTYRAISASGNQNERLIYQYDSARPNENVPEEARHLAAIVGQSVQLQLAPNATLKKIDGLDHIAARILDQTGIPKMLRSEMQNMLEQTSYDQVLRTLNGVALPENSVAIGDSWTAQKKFRALPVQISTKYSLLRRQANSSSLSIHSTIAPHFAPGGLAESTGDAVPLYTGSESGTATIDEATGWPRSFEITQRLLGRMSRTTGEKPGERLILETSPVHIKTVIRGWARVNAAPR